MEEPERQSRPFAVGEIARRMLEPGIPGEGAAGEPRETAGRDRAEHQRHRVAIRVPSGEAARRPVPDAEAAQRLDHGHAPAQDRKIVVPVGVPAAPGRRESKIWDRSVGTGFTPKPRPTVPGRMLQPLRAFRPALRNRPHVPRDNQGNGPPSLSRHCVFRWSVTGRPQPLSSRPLHYLLLLDHTEPLYDQHPPSPRDVQ